MLLVRPAENENMSHRKSIQYIIILTIFVCSSGCGILSGDIGSESKQPSKGDITVPIESHNLKFSKLISDTGGSSPEPFGSDSQSFVRGSDENIFLLDPNNNKIRVFDSSGNHLRDFPSVVTDENGVDLELNAWGIYKTPTSNIVLYGRTVGNQDYIQQFKEDGTKVGTGVPMPGPLGPNALDNQGRLWRFFFSDEGKIEIFLYNLDGTLAQPESIKVLDNIAPANGLSVFNDHAYTLNLLNVDEEASCYTVEVLKISDKGVVTTVLSKEAVEAMVGPCGMPLIDVYASQNSDGTIVFPAYKVVGGGGIEMTFFMLDPQTEKITMRLNLPESEVPENNDEKIYPTIPLTTSKGYFGLSGQGQMLHYTWDILQ